MYNSKLKTPVVTCAILGLAAVSYIAYYFYTRNKKKTFLDRLKKLYSNDRELYPNENLSDEEPYEVIEPSDLSDFLLVQPSDPLNMNGYLLDEDRYNRFDKLQEVAYIEDLSRDGRPNKGYKLLGNPHYAKSNSSSTSSSRHLTNQPEKYNKDKLSRRAKKEKQDSYEGWTVLDNFTNLDGYAEELTYVEKTINTFSEVLDLEENQFIQVEYKITIEPTENTCCPNCSNLNVCCNNNHLDYNEHNENNNNNKENITNTNNKEEEKLNTNSNNQNKEMEMENKTKENETEENKEKEEYDENNLEYNDLNDNNLEYNDLNDNVDDYQTVNPESVKIYLKNFGCSHNISDSEYMLGLLDEHGYKIVDSMKESNLVIINSCTVKGPSEEGMVTQIKLARQLGLPVIVAGCVPQSDKSNPVFNEQQISLLGVTQIDRIVEMVENSLMGRKMTLLEKKELPQLDLPKIRKDKLIEIIPLSTGCLGSCTFCKTKHSRGVLGSYDIEVLLDRVESCLKEGVKEIWLTSEDLGAYGIDIGTDIVTLLNSIVAILPKDVMIRLGMSNPPYIKKHINDICEILKNDNVYEFIHIPVQSFSDDVLDKMNREYHVEDFIYLVDVIRTKIPNCTIATDIISGFPTETHEDHLKTKHMLEQLKLPVVNISQFYPRKGTVASKMKQLRNKIGKNRSREITEVFMSYETNSKFVDQEFKVYFNHINERKQLVGHNKQYVKVILVFQDNNKDNKEENTNNNNNNNKEEENNNKNNNIKEIENNNKDNKNNNKHNEKQKQNKENNEDYNNILKYYGTVQNVKIIKSTKWHLEGILV